MALLIPQASEALCRRLSPEPSFPSLGRRTWVGTRGGGRGKTSLPQHSGLLCGSPYPELAPHRLWENLQGSTPGKLTVMEKVGRVCNSQHMDLSGRMKFLPALPK